MYQSAQEFQQLEDDGQTHLFDNQNEHSTSQITSIKRAQDFFRRHRRTLTLLLAALSITLLYLSYSTTQDKLQTQSPINNSEIQTQHNNFQQQPNLSSSSDLSLFRKNSPSDDTTSSSTPAPSSDADNKGSALINGNCDGPYPGYPFCQSKVDELTKEWNKDQSSIDYYTSQNVDGTKCSFLNYLNLHGFYCPAAQDFNKEKIRGVNLGGWLVLEPWITPSLFAQFTSKDAVVDQWTFCEVLGKVEAKKQLKKHWDSFLTYDDLSALAASGLNHVRIPLGYWLFGDIKENEPWVDGDLFYLERALGWCKQLNLNVILDLHTGPGSQNGFDNSGRKGEIHFDKAVKSKNGVVIYPNIDRALDFIDSLTRHFVKQPYTGTVVAIELINEAFITIPLPIVKDYYIRGYEVVKKYVTKETGDIAVIIGDSFRFQGSWDDFMLPPHYQHVWIDTHIYHVFDMNLLSKNWSQHIDKVCLVDKPSVEIAPLSTLVGEWSLATTDCANQLNGAGIGSRFDGTYPNSWPLGSCDGESDSHTYTTAYRTFLREFAEKQMDAYESGSSEGWFFWNFKTETSPEWNYLEGLTQGWIPKQSQRTQKCQA